MDKIDEFLSRADIPLHSPLPLPQLFSALRNVNGDLSEVVQLITFDPTLTARVLKNCNSVFFSRAEPVGDVTSAVNRLGYRNLYRVVAAVKGSQLFQPRTAAMGVDGEQLWRHSVGAAFAAQFIAADFGEDTGTYFTAGLLHDLGKIVLGVVYSDEYADIVAQAEESGTHLAELEQSQLGVDHAQAGARLLKVWNFPNELVSDVEFHHRPAGTENPKSAAIVCFADYLAHLNDEQQPDAPLPADAASALELLELSTEASKRYQDLVQENVQFIEAMYQIAN